MLSASRKIICSGISRTFNRNISFVAASTSRIRNNTRNGALCTCNVQLGFTSKLKHTGLPPKYCRYLCITADVLSPNSGENAIPLEQEVGSADVLSLDTAKLIAPLEVDSVSADVPLPKSEENAMEIDSAFEEVVDRSKLNDASTNQAYSKGMQRNTNVDLVKIRFSKKEQVMESFMKEYEQSIADDKLFEPLMAYQYLRKCSLEILKETPETRVEIAKEMWRLLAERDFVFEISHYNALLSAYTVNQHQFSPLDFLKEMDQKGLHPNTRTFSDFVLAYCQIDDTSGALRIIEVMKDQGLPLDSAYSALVIGYTRNGKLDKAEEVMKLIEVNGIKSDSSYLKAFAIGCAEKGEMKLLEWTIDSMVKLNIYVDGLPAVKIVEALGKFGHLDLIDKVFEKLGKLKYSETELRALFRTWLKEGSYRPAAVLLKNQPLWSNVTDVAQLNSIRYFINYLVDQNKPLDEVFEAIDICQEVFQTDTGLEETLKAYHGRKDTDNSLSVIYKLVETGKPVSVFYFYPILKQMSSNKDMRGIHGILDYLTDQKIRTDPQAMKYILHGFEEPTSCCVELIDIPKNNYRSLPYDYLLRERDRVLDGDNLHLFTAIASLFTRFGHREDLLAKVDDFLKRTFNPEETPKVFKLLEIRNVLGFKLGLMINSIFDSAIKSFGSEKAEEGFIFVKQLTDLKVRSMNPGTYSRLLDVLCQRKLKDKFYETLQIMEDNNVTQTRSHNALMLRMAARLENSAEAQLAFDRLEDPNERMYNNLLSAYGKYCKPGVYIDHHSPEHRMYMRRIIEIYDDMVAKGFVPYDVPLTYLIIANLSEGKIDAADDLKRSFGYGASWMKYTVYNEYLRAYTRYGRMQAAEKLFEEIKTSDDDTLKPSFFAYYQLLSGYKKNGDIDKMKTLVDEMRTDGIRESHKTTATFVEAYLIKNDIPAAVELIASITKRSELPPKSFLTPLIRKLVENGDVESITKAMNVISQLGSQFYNENQVNNFLLLANVRATDLDAAAKIIEENEDFKLNGRLIAKTIQNMSTDVTFLENMKNFLKKRNLPHYIMDLPLMTAYEHHRHIDSAIELCSDKLANIEEHGDGALPKNFLIQMANFAEREGRPVPFPKSLLKEQYKSRGQRERRTSSRSRTESDNIEVDRNTNEREGDV